MISYFFTLGLSPCTAWVGYKYIKEVISPFRTVPRQKMTAQFLFFQSLPPKKANFVKKRPIELGVLPLIEVNSLMFCSPATNVWCSIVTGCSRTGWRSRAKGGSPLARHRHRGDRKLWGRKRNETWLLNVFGKSNSSAAQNQTENWC